MRKIIGLLLAVAAFTIDAAPAKNIDHIVTVAKSGGDYSSIKKALASIQDSSKTNRYQIFIGPGVFSVTEQINMKSGVSIKGSGIGVTTLVSRIKYLGSERAMFFNGLAESTSISELSVDMYINATYHSDRVLVCKRFCPRLKDVDFRIHSNLPLVRLIGIDLDVDFYTQPSIFENIFVNVVSRKATDPQESIGIRTISSGLNLVRSKVRAQTAIEMANLGGTIRDSVIQGSTYSNGIAISVSAFFEERNSVLSITRSSVSSGGDSIAVKVDDVSPMLVSLTHSTLNGALQGPGIGCTFTSNGGRGVLDGNCVLIE